MLLIHQETQGVNMFATEPDDPGLIAVIHMAERERCVPPHTKINTKI